MVNRLQAPDLPAPGFAPAWCQMSYADCRESGVSQDCRNHNPGPETPSPDWDAGRLRAASRAAGIGLWEWDVDTNTISMDGESCALWGVFSRGKPTFEMLSAHVYAPDRARMKRAILAARTNPGPYDIEFRILRDDALLWIAVRGLGAADGLVGRTMFGVFLDVTARRRSEEARELLAEEMSHRVKNLFAVAGSLTAIAARSTTSKTEMEHDLIQRLASLGHAQDLIRKDRVAGGKTALLANLLAAFLSPYDDKARPGQRLVVTLPTVQVGEVAATALALIFHELATNSVKYGALSSPDGSLEIRGTADQDIVQIEWLERGGPPVRAPKGSSGFGSRLIARSVIGQLGGDVSFDWQSQGLVVHLTASALRMGA